MRVVATQVGQYNQIMREVGEVFDLLNYADGSYPHKTREVAKKDKDGKPIAGEYELQVVIGKDKKPVHRDFAPDLGTKVIRSGPLRGEVVQSGWMKAVSDKVQVGLYPPGTDFWTPNVMLPQVWQRPMGQQDRRAASIEQHMPKPELEDLSEFEDG